MELRSAFGGQRFLKCHVAHCKVCGCVGWRELVRTPTIGQCDDSAVWTPAVVEPRQFMIARLQRSIDYAKALNDVESIPINQFALDTITQLTNRHCIEPITPKKLLSKGKFGDLTKRAMSKVRKKPACVMPEHLTTLGLEAAGGTSTASGSSSSVMTPQQGVAFGHGERPACVIAYSRP
jgi:hypothetical protein